MKVTDKKNIKKDKVKKKDGVNKTKPKKEQVLVVAQEIKYARWLSGNDKKTRDRVLKALKKWILNCFEKGYEFKENDFTRVWKGLFYAVWMSDKPLIQEELCENIANVLDLFPAERLKDALLMTKAGLKMLATEWYGIDHHRMDKFLMLVRRYLRGSLRCLARTLWTLDACRKYARMLSGTDGLFAIQTPHYARNATSMLLHFTDCFLEELAKVSEGKISEESVAALLRPFVQYTCSGPTLSVCTASRRVLTALLRQSELGLEYEERTRAWKQMGCPAGGPDVLQPMSDDEADEEGDGDQPLMNGDAGSDDEHDDERTERALDPRAGRVDVELPLLPVPASLLANMLKDMLQQASSKAHRRVKICLQRFESLAAGQYPLPVSTSEAEPQEPIRSRGAARALYHLEHKLKADADELKLRGLSRKHRKRLLKKTRLGLSIVEDVEGYNKALSKDSNNGEWIVESTETKSKDTSNKENQDKDNKTKKKSKVTAMKRRNSTDVKNGDVNSKKLKLDESNKNNLDNKNKTKNKVDNKKDKKTNLVIKDNKTNNLINSKTDKKNKEKHDSGQKDVSKVETKVITKQKDVKEKNSKHNEIKKDSLKDDKDIKSKKSKTLLSSDKTAKLAKSEKSFKSEIKDQSIKNILSPKSTKSTLNAKTKKIEKKSDSPTFAVNKVKNFQKQLPNKDKRGKKDLPIKKPHYETPKKVKFVLKNNSMQQPVDYYKSVRQSPSIPFDSSKKPTKTNLKPSTPSPINPFFKKKLRMKN